MEMPPAAQRLLAFMATLDASPPSPPAVEATTPAASEPALSPRNSPPLVPFPPQATRRILECPHILEAIVAHTLRATQVVCLQASRKMFEASGRALYHTVRIDGDNMEGFFRGALIGAHFGVNENEELAKCGFTQGLNTCALHDPNDTASVSKTTDNAEPERPTSSSKSEDENKKNEAKNNDHKKNKDEVYPITTEQGANKTPAVNFKAGLLKHVRVLTISTHHACACHVYGPHAKDLLPNLEVARVASDFMQVFTLFRLCDAQVCSLLAHIHTRKLVLRNVDGGGLPLQFFGEEAPTCEELVVFLTMDARRYHTEFKDDGYYNSLQELGYCFPEAPDIKVVFYPTWEGWNEGDEPFSFIHGHAPLPPDDVIYLLGPLFQYADPKHTIYGMGKLRWEADGDIVHTFRHFFPNTKLSQRAILDLVRHELRTGSLGLALLGSKDDKFEYDPGYPEHHTYKTFTEYLKDKDGRRGEINADD